MAAHQQLPQELEAHLAEHLGFLRASVDAYDAGYDGEAKRIAVSVRVLVHDTSKSKSLLGQLGRKSAPFADSALPLVPGNKLTYSGLTVQSMVPGAGVRYVPFLDDRPLGAAATKDFESWWTAPVFLDSKGRELSRKDLVLAVANQDGGAHVDPALDSAYADLSRNNSLAWIYSDGSTTVPLGGPERAALRQIGHEVLKTLVPGYAKAPTYPEAGIIVGQATLLKGRHAAKPTQQSVPQKKVGRNEPCPCGSGLKYKRCCGALA